MTSAPAQSPPTIVVVGSSMVDLVAYADPLPQAGETVIGSAFQQGFGGKGANQAVTARRLGAQVALVACLGTDLFGPLTLDRLADEGIDTSHVALLDGEVTGMAPIWVEADGTNRIIVVPGANESLDAERVTRAMAAQGSAAAVVCQLEVGDEAVAEAMRIGRSWGAVTVLNPAPARRSAVESFGDVDWVVPNESEFALLWGAEAAPDQIAAAAESWGCGVVVTLGERGAMAVVDDGCVSCPPPAVAAIDTTGAGDAFVGGFSFALALERPVVEAIELGNVCGALSTTVRGTQTSFPTSAAVRALSEETAA